MKPLPTRPILGPQLLVASRRRFAAARWRCFALALAAACGDDANGSDDAGGAACEDSVDAATDAGDEPSAECAADPIPGFEDVEIFAKCQTCHSTEVQGDARNGATEGVNFDDYDSAVGAADRAALYVFHGTMPPRRSGITVTECEKQQLYQWALCGTPE
jgi:hypothetical protein